MEQPEIPLAQSPNAWRRTAIGLKRSADIIWDQWFEIFSRLEGGKVGQATPQEVGDLYLLLPSFLLLSGLAFENALKGLLVAHDPSTVNSAVKWKKAGGHDLHELYKKSRLLISTDEQELLDALTQAILWSGRYPVPKHHDNKSDFPIPIGPFFKDLDVNSVVSRFLHLKKTCDNLFSRALSQYPEEEET